VGGSVRHPATTSLPRIYVIRNLTRRPVPILILTLQWDITNQFCMHNIPGDGGSRFLPSKSFYSSFYFPFPVSGDIAPHLCPCSQPTDLLDFVPKLGRWVSHQFFLLPVFLPQIDRLVQCSSYPYPQLIIM
jgi:hypothetical protein